MPALAQASPASPPAVDQLLQFQLVSPPSLPESTVGAPGADAGHPLGKTGRAARLVSADRSLPTNSRGRRRSGGTRGSSEPLTPAVTWWGFSSPLGWLGWHVTPAGVRQLRFGYRTLAELLQALAPVAADAWRIDSTSPTDRWSADLYARLTAYTEGDRVKLSDLPCDLAGKTPFQRKVLSSCQQIGYGEVVSYRELAERVGCTGGARAVGSVMAQNPLPLIIPCHRVVPQNGKLGGFSAPGGVATKARLLALEGSSWVE